MPRAPVLRLLPLLTFACLPLVGCGRTRSSEAGSSSSTSSTPPELSIAPQSSGTGALLQAVAPVDERVVWLSGHDATFAVTTDGGARWSARTVPGAEGLQFRDVAAFGPDVAYLMSSGTGAQSRIYRTDDGGSSWTLQYSADHPDAFLDCMGFWSPERGLAYGDAVDEAPFVLATSDGGATWARVGSDALPRALEGEGGFAASGTCLVTGADGHAWIATGNGPEARVLHTADYGASWEAVVVPVVAGSSAGLATVAMDPAASGAGVALGGVVGEDTLRAENVAVTRDGGATWSPGGALPMDGPVYGSSLVPGAAGVVVAVGPRGLSWSADGGGSWAAADTVTYWAVGFASPSAGWAVGPGGRVVRLALTSR